MCMCVLRLSIICHPVMQELVYWNLLEIKSVSTNTSSLPPTGEQFDGFFKFAEKLTPRMDDREG